MAFVVGVFTATRMAQAENVDPQHVMDLSFFCLVAAIVGSRLFFILQNFGDYLSRPLDMIKIWQGGLVYYGGLIGAVAVGILYLRKQNLPVMKFADFMAPGIAIGHSVGRWACVFAGCCYGKPTDLPWGITFWDPHAFAPKGIPLHPVQIYESLGEFGIFLFLLTARKRKQFDGQLFLSYLGFYSLLRFITEFFRGDDRGHIIGQTFSTPQTVSIVILCAVLAVTLVFRKAKHAV